MARVARTAAADMTEEPKAPILLHATDAPARPRAPRRCGEERTTPAR